MRACVALPAASPASSIRMGVGDSRGAATVAVPPARVALSTAPYRLAVALLAGRSAPRAVVEKLTATPTSSRVARLPAAACGAVPGLETRWAGWGAGHAWLGIPPLRAAEAGHARTRLHGRWVELQRAQTAIGAQGPPLQLLHQRVGGAGAGPTGRGGRARRRALQAHDGICVRGQQRRGQRRDHAAPQRQRRLLWVDGEVEGALGAGGGGC